MKRILILSTLLVAASLAADAKTAHIPLIYLTALVSPQETRDLNGQVGGRPGVSKRAPLAELVTKIDELTPGRPSIPADGG